jgi:pyridoxine 5-phosphate synthase
MQDADLWALKPLLQTKMNLELAPTAEMIGIALDLTPEDVCFVPERREERTTEGGLDVIGQYPTIHAAAHKLMDAGIRVSLFIAPCLDQIQKAIDMHIPVIEIHTGHYAELEDEDLRKAELQHIKKAIDFAVSHGLVVNAGHGLHYENVQEIAAIKGIDELNIGHAIVAEALFVGWEHAIKRMRAIITEVSGS